MRFQTCWITGVPSGKARGHRHLATPETVPKCYPTGRRRRLTDAAANFAERARTFTRGTGGRGDQLYFPARSRREKMEPGPLRSAAVPLEKRKIAVTWDSVSQWVGVCMASQVAL